MTTAQTPRNPRAKATAEPKVSPRGGLKQRAAASDDVKPKGSSPAHNLPDGQAPSASHTPSAVPDTPLRGTYAGWARPGCPPVCPTPRLLSKKRDSRIPSMVSVSRRR